jgi:hypothetical protein
MSNLAPPSAEEEFAADMRAAQIERTAAIQKWRDDVTADFEAGNLAIINGWLVSKYDGCNCAGGTVESNGMHERGCGWEPIVDLAAHAEFADGRFYL